MRQTRSDARHKQQYDRHLACFVFISVSTTGDAAVSVRVDSRPVFEQRPRCYFPAMDFPMDDWSDPDLDDDFPLGDGTAETEAHVQCPYCGEFNEIALDPGSGDDQEYVEDCHVCCRPILMYVKYGRDGRAAVEVYASDS